MESPMICRAWLPCTAVTLLLTSPLAAVAQEAITLREDFRVGYSYHVSTRTDLSGTLTLPPEVGQKTGKTLAITGKSGIEYDERVLSVTGGGQVDRSIRQYRRMDFERRVGDRPQESSLRPEVRRLILIRTGTAEVPFSPDAPLLWAEIDLVRTDVFTPALAGLLPDRAVKPGDRWQAALPAIQELTDLEKIEGGQVECRFDQITDIEKRRYARVTLTGSVRGTNEDGPNQQTIDGYYFFDLSSMHLGYLYLKGVSALLDKEGKPQGTIEGRFVLTRQLQAPVSELSDVAIRGMALEPNAENTQLLYDNADLGIRFRHPRRWRVAGVRGAQVALDENSGHGLLLTIEPASQVPATQRFFGEARDWLQKQKARVNRVESPQRVPVAGMELERFSYDVDLSGQRQILDYYVLRQGSAGLTAAARLLPRDTSVFQREVEQILRSVTLSVPPANRSSSGPQSPPNR